MNAPEQIREECDLLFFEVGGQTYAADPLEVARIDRLSDALSRATITESASLRVLVAHGASEDFQIPVDRVLGVRRLPKSALRRAPPLAHLMGGPRATEILGAVLDGQKPILILDLNTLSARATRATQQGL